MDQAYTSPPAKKDNTLLIIIIVVVVALLLCCCCTIIGFFTMGPQIESIFQDIERELSQSPALLAMLA